MLKERQLLVICFLLLTLITTAQKYDRNWVFGVGAGIDFNDTSNIQIYWTKAFNFEVAGSISDTSGNLLFYIGRKNNGKFNIYNKLNNVITNGDSIKIHLSMTYGVLILPKPNSENVFYLFHNDIYDPITCSYHFCIGLYYSIVKINALGELEFVRKNIPIILDDLGEKLTAVRHGNGIDWWIVTQTAQRGNGFPCTSRFLIYKLTNDTFSLDHAQDISYNLSS